MAKMQHKETAKTWKRIEVGLVLQGGGALGAYEWGAVTGLLELMDNVEAQGRAIDLIAVSGVSIGAINAACIVGAKSRVNACARLKSLWQDLALETPAYWSSMRLDLSSFGLPSIDPSRDLSLWGLPGFYVPRADVMQFAKWTSYYDTRPLIATLERHIDFDALNASGTKFSIAAVNIKTGKLTRFRNYAVTETEAKKDAIKARFASKAIPDNKHERITPSHIRASGSLPPQFPWTTIGKDHYWDGGIVDNAPLSDVMDAFSPGEDVERLVVVMNLYPLHAQLPQNLHEVDDRVHELSYGNRVRQDHETAERLNHLVATIQQLAKLVPESDLTSELRDDIAKAALLKVVRVVEIDMQNPHPDPSQQQPFDDMEGLRDFSPRTIERRRALGREIALGRLEPVLGHLPPTAQPAAAEAVASRS